LAQVFQRFEVVRHSVFTEAGYPVARKFRAFRATPRLGFIRRAVSYRAFPTE